MIHPSRSDFSDHPALFDGWALDEVSDIADQRRAIALQQLFKHGGADAVLNLASELKSPYLVVQCAATMLGLLIGKSRNCFQPPSTATRIRFTLGFLDCIDK